MFSQASRPLLTRPSDNCKFGTADFCGTPSRRRNPMHSPFSLSALIPPSVLGQDAVTAIVLHANRVLIGTEKGALLVFDLSNASTSSATLVSRHDGFAKKAIDQLGVIKELNALICLSGGDLTLHLLPTFTLLSSFASQTRSAASLFVLSTLIHYPTPPPRRSNSASRSPHPPSAPEIHTTLAVACKRKLLLFSWVDGTWNAPSELGLPHQIRGMAFGEGGKGARKLVAGFSTGEYGIISLPAQGDANRVPALGELFSPPIPAAVVSAIAGAAAPPPTASSGALGSYGERLGGLGGLAKATGSVMGLSALGSLSLGGKKVDKNGVVAVPRAVATGKKAVGKGRDPGAWLWGKEWGWDEDEKSGKEDEVLVVRENVALPLTVSGRPRLSDATGQAILHPTPVDETLVLPPYIVSLLPALPLTPGGPPSSLATLSPTIAIHALDSLSLVQTLDVPPRLASPPASVAESGISTTSSTATDVSPTTARLFAVSSSAPQPPILLLTSTPLATGTGSEQTIWIVTMKSWEAQILELGQKGAWEKAIWLLRRSGPGGGELPPPLLRRLAILHALSLFNDRRYDVAIDAFIALDLSPAKVVSLCPERISGKLFLEPAAREEVFGGRPQHKVLAAIEDADRVAEAAEEARVKVASAPSSPVKGSPMKGGKVYDDDTASVASGRTTASRLTSSKSWLRDRETKNEQAGETLEAIAERAAADRQKQELLQAKQDALNFSRSVDVLIRYLTDRRQKYAQALSALLPSARPSPSASRPPASAAELFALPDAPLTDLDPDQLARVAQVVDTALFKSYLATKPVMVGPLCRIENWCEVEEVEELLLNAKKYRELLDLYNGKNMHEKAVKLLRQMSEDEEDLEEKVGPTVRYLQKLGAEQLSLIFESSRWIFEVNRAAGLEIFIADLEEVESLPRHATMAHLERIGPDVCITYLEHIVHHLGEEGAEFHEKLIELYLAQVHSPNKTGSDEAYQKLLDLLESSTAYRADRMLGRLPSEDMHEVRAILLGRLGRHEGALQIYVYQLDDHATAEEYCKRVYESDPAMRSTIFHLLLRIYLRPRPNHPLLFTPALSLISAHASSIDAIEVFDLLPPLVALSDIKVFLQKTLRRSGERAREAKIVKGIGRSWVDAGEREVVELEERRVKITDARVCPQCHKRLGNSVIAIHSPHGEVTHYQCREDFSANRKLLSS